jgi:hypothetical protein
MRRELGIALACLLIAACDARTPREGPSAAEAMKAINEASGAELFQATGLDPRWSAQVLDVKDLNCKPVAEDEYNCDVLVLEPMMTGSADKPAWSEVTETKAYGFIKEPNRWRAKEIPPGQPGGISANPWGLALQGAKSR